MDNGLLVKSIRNLCKKNKVAVSQLENELNYGAGLISRWNKNSPSIDKIVDIANYFHVSIDEVVGYNINFDDTFLKELISRTENQVVTWEGYDDNSETIPKVYSESIPQNLIFDSNEDYDRYISQFKDLSYYTRINDGYIVIYARYMNQEIVKPIVLRLFIQPTNDSDLIYQKYNMEQLTTLWLKIIYSLNESAPNEIKAEIFKSDFINSNIDSQS